MTPLVGLRSRRHIAPFALHRPGSVAEAVGLRHEPGTSAYMAGGLDLVDWLKHGHALDRVIRIDGIPDIAGARVEGGMLRVGAATTHAALIRDADAIRLAPGLVHAWATVANPRTRYAGTVGGNLMAAHRDYDGLPAMLALDAQAEVAGPGGRRRIPVAELAQDGGLLTALHIPVGGILLADRTLRPTLTVWLGVTLSAGLAVALRVTVGMAYATAPVIALTLEPKPVPALAVDAAMLAAQVVQALPDCGYPRRMAGVLTRRLLIRAGSAA